MKVVSFVYCPAYQLGYGDGYFAEIIVEISGEKLYARKQFDRYSGDLPYSYVQKVMQSMILDHIRKELFE